MALVPLQLVHVKMLPFDNKSEFQVIVDMPEGTALEQTARVAAALADAAAERSRGARHPDLRRHCLRRTTSTAWCGTTSCAAARMSPTSRSTSLPKDERTRQSHEIAKRVRERLLPIARRFGATIKVAEVPPGPPVLQTLVAEVYGPDAGAAPAARARRFERVMEQHARCRRRRLVHRGAQPTHRSRRGRGEGGAAGVPPAPSRQPCAWRAAVSLPDCCTTREPRRTCRSSLQLPRAASSDLRPSPPIRLAGRRAVAIGELTREARIDVDKSIYHKNLKPVTYVTGDVAGEAESPVYAILEMNRELAEITMPEGYGARDLQRAAAHRHDAARR